MGDGIYVALSGAIAQTTNLDTTANNLANASTDGYQRERPVFHEMLSNAASEGHHYAGVSATALDTTAGSIRTTDRPLDVALPKGAYLAVQTNSGERYTRAGAMTVSLDGFLTTRHGDKILGENNQPIKVPDGVGEVKATRTGAIEKSGQSLGQLKIVQFDRPECLTHEGGTALASNVDSGTAKATNAQLEVGAVEESNASVVASMNDLVDASRTFDAFQRAIDAFRDADKKIVSTTPNPE
ncbi:MAG: flagellar hook basal-body protein [Polyangiaceae bacterium]